MTEISTIYQPPTASGPPGATVITATPTNGSPRGGGATTRSTGYTNAQGRAFQIRQGSFKLNALRLPSTVSRFVIMQVIFSCVCATLGILSVAFRCWMAYLCIPVIVGAMELLIGIIGYTAIKRPRKKALVKVYFAGNLFGSLAGLGLVIFSIIAAATEDENECSLLPNVVATCNVGRGARFAIELTTVVVGITEIVVTQVMFMIMCYGSCSRIQSEDQRSRSRARRINPAEDIPANLELPPYDEHHNYPTSPFHDASFFITPTSQTGFEPPSYTNIGLVNDETPGGIAPIAAAMGTAVHPAEPPPPYTLYASNPSPAPLAAAQNPSHNTPRTAAHPSTISGTISTVGNVQNQLEANVERIIRGENVRRSGPSVLSYAPPQTNLAFDIQSGWRDRTIHQSLRLSSEQSSEWNARVAHQRQFNDSDLDQRDAINTSDEDPSIVPAELYRDQIRRSGHRYSLSDPSLQSRNSRNRQRSRQPLETTQSAGRAALDAAIVPVTTPQEREVIATVHRQSESTPHSHYEQRGNSPRRHQGPPPPYEGRHNVVRTNSNSLNQTVIDSRHSRDRNEDSPSHHRSHTSQNQERNGQARTMSGEQFQESVQQIRTSPRSWRVEEPQEAIYETIPSPQSSPAHHHQRESSSDSSIHPEEDYSRTRNSAAVCVNPIHQQGMSGGNAPVLNYSTSWGIEIEEDDEEEDDDGVVVRSGSWRWEENVAPVTSRTSGVGQDLQRDHRQMPDQDSPSGPETRTQQTRQPPPYGGRRQHTCAPPPYKPRNRSLPNYARRQNLTSPPPPYQGHQQRSSSVDASDRTRSTSGHVVQEWNDGSRTSGRAVREMPQPQDRLDQANRESGHLQRPVTRDTLQTGDLRVRISNRENEHYCHRAQSFHDSPQTILSHSLPRMAVSSLAISPPSSSSSSRRTASPSPSRQNPTSSSSSSVVVTPTGLTFSESSSAFSPALSSSSSAASPRAYREVWLEPPKRTPKRTTSSPSYPSSYRDARQSSAVAPNYRQTQQQQHPQRPRPIPAVRTSRPSSQHPIPLHPSSPTAPPTRTPQNQPSSKRSAPSGVPLHPLSVRQSTPQSNPSPKSQRTSKPEVAPRSRPHGKPAAEIQPFRTVRSSPVKRQRAFNATKALANALQKGHLNDLLDEYEETII